jgi:hypothetical protein
MEQMELMELRAQLVRLVLKVLPEMTALMVLV